MNVIRIAVFTTDFPMEASSELSMKGTWWGGVGVAASRTATELRTRGHQVEVFTISGGNEVTTQTREGVVIHSYPADFIFGETAFSLEIMLTGSEERPDVVHAHRGSPSGTIAGWLFSRRNKVPLVISYHGELFFENRKPHELVMLRSFEYLENRILKTADAIITVSESIAHSPTLRQFAEKTTVIPNGVDLPSNPSPRKQDARRYLQLPADRTVCLYLGALTYRKGFDLVLEASRLLEQTLNPLLVIVGHQPTDLNQSRGPMGDAGANRNVRFEGFVPNRLKPYYYAAADMLLLPSRLEGLPITLLEAFAHQVPVVASNIPALREVLEPGGYGLLFESGDAADLVAKIQLLASSPRLRTELVEREKNAAGRYSWTKVANETAAVYERVIRTRLQ